MRLDLRPTLNAFQSVQRLHDAGDTPAWVIEPGAGFVNFIFTPTISPAPPARFTVTGGEFQISFEDL